MNESQFIVPPSDGKPNNGQSPIHAPKLAHVEKPSTKPTDPKFINWLQSHKALVASLSGAAVVVVLVATVLITKQPVSLFGLQLNPLTPHAQVPPPCDPVDPTCDLGGGGGGGTGTPVDAPNILLTIGDSNSTSPNLPNSCDAEVSGPGASVSVNGSADCLKVNISNPKQTYSKDFRICFGLDNDTAQCTPWASVGGGSTPQITSGGSFSSAQVRVEYQDAPVGKVISGVEVGVQLFYQNNNGPCGASSGLNWAKAIAGQNTSNPWSFGAQQDDDPGCGLMSLRAQLVDASTATPITIEGAFPNGTVGVPISQAFNLFGVANPPCTWAVDSITPPLSGAVITTGANPGTTATFQANPDTVTTYQIALRSTCQSGQVATKTLSWVVDAAPVNIITIDGSFANGTVGQPFSQNLILSGQANLPCTWSLSSITPSVSGAAISATTGLFTATPTASGAYQVAVHVACQSGQVADKTLPWVVGTAPTPQILSIAGSFTEGKAGQAYSTNINSVNAGASNCTFKLEKITPSITGATLTKVDNITQGSETFAVFSATPLVANNYIVSTSVQCPPIGGSGSVRNAIKDFGWKVTGLSQPPTGTITLTGTFPNSTTGQEFKTNILTSGQANLPCTWTLLSVSPTVNGATLTPSTNTDLVNQSSTGFKATPTVAGTYQVTITATCQNGQTATKTFNWIVSGTPSPTSQANCTDPANLPYLTAIYRFWSSAQGDHFYTTNASEKPAGYRAEGIAGYVYNRQVTGTVAIYRSSQPQIGSHYYSTTNDATNYGYTNEGILGYAFADSVTGSVPWYRLHKGGTASDYVNTVSEEERTAIKELGYTDEGVVAQLCGTSQPTALQPIYRMWNGTIKEHFYTTNPAERDSVLAKGFVSEGITGYMYGVRKPGTSTVYRSYHQIEKHHYLSLTEAEATGWGYSIEGIIGYIWPDSQTDTIPLYKLFNPTTRDNLYTASSSEVTAAVNAGYEDQGTLGYMFLNAQ